MVFLELTVNIFNMKATDNFRAPRAPLRAPCFISYLGPSALKIPSAPKNSINVERSAVPMIIAVISAVLFCLGRFMLAQLWIDTTNFTSNLVPSWPVGWVSYLLGGCLTAVYPIP